MRTTFEETFQGESQKNSTYKTNLQSELIEEREVVDLEENLLRLKKEIQRTSERPGKRSNDAQSLSSLKVYKQRGLLKTSHGPRKNMNLTFNKLAGIQKNLKKKQKFRKNKKNFGQGLNGKLYSTMDDNITRQVQSHFKNLNKIAESLQGDKEEISEEKNLLKWRKDRIKNYGKGKFKKGQSKKKKHKSPRGMKRKSTLSEIKKQFKNKKKQITSSLDLKSFISQKKKQKSKEPEILILVSGNYSKFTENETFTENKSEFSKLNLSERAKTEKKPAVHPKSRFSQRKNQQQGSLLNNLVPKDNSKSSNMVNQNESKNPPKTTVSKAENFEVSADSSFEWLMDDKGLPISDMDPSLMNSIEPGNKAKNDSMRRIKEGMSDQWNRHSFQRKEEKQGNNQRRSLGKKFRRNNNVSVEIYENRPRSKEREQSKHSADIMIENKLISQVFDK